MNVGRREATGGKRVVDGRRRMVDGKRREVGFLPKTKVSAKVCMKKMNLACVRVRMCVCILSYVCMYSRKAENGVE